MKQLVLSVTLGIGALAAGLGLVVAAKHFGWLPATAPSDNAAAQLCEHQLAPARCPFCTPELVDSLRWCNEHDVAEALCTRCNSSLVAAFKVEQDWCTEHGVPESQCALCGGGATEAAVQLASNERAVGAGDVMRANRPPSTTCMNAFSTVQLESPEVAQRAGLEVVQVRTETIEETVICNAEVAFDGNRYVQLASRAPGNIAEVLADLGDEVERGAVLAMIDSAELGSAKAAYLQARSLVELWEKNEARERRLFDQNVGTERDLLEAETRLVESRVQLASTAQRLKTLGLTDDAINAVAASDDTSALLELRAPFSGVVVERSAVTGQVISTTQSLFAIADMNSMWVMLDVYESDLARIDAGQRVSLSLDALPDRNIDGAVTWVGAHVDPRTRTIQARAEVSNDDGLLRANMFGRAEVHVRTIDDAVLVPESAVQWDGCCNIVFVRHTDTIYQPYKVTLGYNRDGHYVVTDGLPAGESVVTEGSFLLKTEILKGNIGAGCCEVDPGANE